MKYIIFIISLSLLVACGKKVEPNTNQGIMKNGKVPGFEEQEAERTFPLARITDCRGNIKDVLCLVDPAEKGQKEPRKCLAGGEAYAQSFEELYDNYPPALQKMFCSIRILYIEKKFYATAYASNARDESGNITGVILGIRQSVLDEKLDLTQWASWKEQLSFGGDQKSYKVDPKLPTVKTSSIKKVNDFLYFVIAHEFGHFFDFGNGVNRFDTCRGHNTDCAAKDGSWTAFSWKRDTVASSEFTHRKDLCFYNCKGKYIKRKFAKKVYEDLFDRNFISTYAASNPWDDFADSLAYYVMDKYLDTKYVLRTNQRKNYNVVHALKSDLFREKFNYIETFLNSVVIKYPGQSN